MRARHDRGATLIEIMISMAVVLFGMLAMFSVLRTSIVGSGTAQKIGQAQLRAAAILENIRHAPNTALVCLTTTSAPNWANCEALCKAALTVQNQDACIYTIASFNAIRAPDTSGANGYASTTVGQQNDRSGQAYALWTDATNGSWVQVGGTYSGVYDIQMVVGWNDDATAPANAASYDHYVRLRTAIAQGGP